MSNLALLYGVALDAELRGTDPANPRSCASSSSAWGTSAAA